MNQLFIIITTTISVLLPSKVPAPNEMMLKLQTEPYNLPTFLYPQWLFPFYMFLSGTPHFTMSWNIMLKPMYF